MSAHGWGPGVHPLFPSAALQDGIVSQGGEGSLDTGVPA
jgi:hypothetical protein